MGVKLPFLPFVLVSKGELAELNKKLDGVIRRAQSNRSAAIAILSQLRDLRRSHMPPITKTDWDLLLQKVGDAQTVEDSADALLDEIGDRLRAMQASPTSEDVTALLAVIDEQKAETVAAISRNTIAAPEPPASGEHTTAPPPASGGNDDEGQTS